jgi:UDP-glucose 4-epimerase
MISAEELPRTRYDEKNNIYVMHYKDISEEIPQFKSGEFSSKDVVVQKDELSNIFQKHDFFKVG